MAARFFFIFLICFTFSAHAAPAVPRVAHEAATAHRAIYDIDMVASRSGAEVIDIHGKMYYEWGPSCDAWVTNHRFNLVYEYADSPGMRISSDFSTYELKDESGFYFSSRRSRDGKIYQTLRGHADVTNADYTAPDDLHFDLPHGAVFPTAHTLRMIEETQRDTKFFTATVFDGSDEEGPIEINTFIGEVVNPLKYIKPSPLLDMSLLNTPAHKVRMAVFPLSSEEEHSDYEMSLIFHDNGIISDMTIDYDDFSVRQSLVALEKADLDRCAEPKEKPAPLAKVRP